MPIARITGQGLAAIALSVALLWACLIGERLTLNRSTTLRAQVIRELRQMQLEHSPVPVSAPARRGPASPRTKVG